VKLVVPVPITPAILLPQHHTSPFFRDCLSGTHPRKADAYRSSNSRNCGWSWYRTGSSPKPKAGSLRAPTDQAPVSCCNANSTLPNCNVNHGGQTRNDRCREWIWSGEIIVKRKTQPSAPTHKLTLARHGARNQPRHGVIFNQAHWSC